MINVKKSLKKRKKDEKRDKNLGSHLKRRRLELKQKQGWVAQGICSVSYLSKIENNKAEENKMLVREIMHRLDVDPRIFQINIEDEQYLMKAIRAFYYHDAKELDKIFQEVKSIEHNLTINLVKLCYLVFHSDEKAVPLVLMLEESIANMNDLDLQAFLVFAGYFYITRKEYLFAYELFDISIGIVQENEYLTALENKKMFEIKQYLGIKNSSIKFMYEAERLLQKHHNRYRIDKLNLIKINHLFKEDVNAADEELKTLQSVKFHKTLLDKYYLISAKTNVRLSKEQLAKEYLSLIKQDSVFYVDALFLEYQMTDDEKEKDAIAKLINEQAIAKEHMTIIIKFRLMRLKEIEEQKEYIKDVAIPYAKKTHNLDLFHDFVIDITGICIATSRYKEATQYIKAYIKEREKMYQYIEELSSN